MLRGAPATGTFSCVNEGWFGPLSSDCSRRWMPGGLRWALKAAVPFMEVRGGAVQKAARAMEGKGQGSKQGRVREASRLNSTRFHFLLTLQRSCTRRRRRAGCGGPVSVHPVCSCRWCSCAAASHCGSTRHHQLSCPEGPVPVTTLGLGLFGIRDLLQPAQQLMPTCLSTLGPRPPCASFLI